MAANLDLLNPELKAKAITLIARCATRGFVMRANNGLRDPFEQAKLWRQSRSIEEITKRSTSSARRERTSWQSVCARSGRSMAAT